MPPKQHEYWIDPSGPEGKNYVKKLITEVAAKNILLMVFSLIIFAILSIIAVQKWVLIGAGRMRFEHETGLNLDCTYLTTQGKFGKLGKFNKFQILFTK